MASARLAVVLALVALASARKLTWIGANNHFDNAANWDSFTGSPSAVTLGGARPVDVYVPAKEHEVGSKITLFEGVRLVFEQKTDANGNPVPAVFKFKEGNPVNERTFSGGQSCTSSRDLLNFANWRVGTTNGAFICEDDEGIFPATSTFSVCMDLQNPDNVPYWAARDLQFMDVTYDSCDDLRTKPAMFNMITSTNCRGGRLSGDPGTYAEYCEPLGLLDEDQATCTCVFTNNPTAAQKQVIDNAILEGEKKLADQAEAELATLIDRDFDATLSASDLGVTDDEFKELFRDIGSTTTNEDLKTQFALMLNPAWEDKLKELFGVDPDDNTQSLDVTSIVIDVDGATVQVSGDMTVPVGSFVDADNTYSTFFDAQGNVRSGIPTLTQDNDARFALLKVPFLDVAEAFWKKRTEEAVTNDCVGGDSARCELLNSLAQTVVAAVTDPSALLDALLNDPACANAFDGDCLDATPAQAKAGQESNLESAAGSLLGLELVNPDLAYFKNLFSLAVQQYTSENRDRTVAGLKTYQGEVPFGALTTDLQASLVINPTNAAGFTSAVSSAMVGKHGIVGVDVTSIAAYEDTPARRRRGVAEDYRLIINFEYSKVCTTECSFAVGDETYVFLQDELDRAVKNFQAQSHSECYTLDVNLASPYDDKDQYNQTCLEQLGASTCSATSGTPAAKRAAAKTAILAVYACNGLGRKPDGSCYVTRVGVDTEVTQMVNDLEECKDVTNPGNPQASSGGGSGAGLPIIAAAAVGGILVIVLAIFLYKRSQNRARGRTAASSTDRNVVAFENPMYDDPGLSGSGAATPAQPVYDDAGAEGLYDEPAFAVGADKANPLYDSTEDLTRDAGGYLDTAPAAEGGYLDTAPADEGGYLDTAPATEDTGYLDVNPDEQ